MTSMPLPDQPEPDASGAVPPLPTDTRALGALGAIGEMFQDAVADRDIPRRRVISWAMWDWAMQPFNTVILTFVWIALYLTSRQFLDPAGRVLADPLQNIDQIVVGVNLV